MRIRINKAILNLDYNPIEKIHVIFYNRVIPAIIFKKIKILIKKCKNLEKYSMNINQ